MALKISHSCDSYQYVKVHAGLQTPYSQVLVLHFNAHSSILVLLISSFSLNSLRLRGFPSRSYSAFLYLAFLFSPFFVPSALSPLLLPTPAGSPDRVLSAAVFSLLLSPCALNSPRCLWLFSPPYQQ